MEKIQRLMQLFCISGKDLASMLFVDQSLVSKWRSGKRTLKAGSIHLTRIVALFMKLDAHNNYARLRQLFPTDDLEGPDELAFRLETWLLSGNTSELLTEEIPLFDLTRNAKLCNMYSFNDNKGRRRAISIFEEYAASCKGPLSIITYNTEDATWFYEDRNFIRRSRQDNLCFLKKGGKLVLIHPLNTTYDNLAFSILNWMPLYLSGLNIRGYYIPRYSDDLVNYTYFVIKDRLALYGLSTQKSKQMLTLMFQEKQVVNRIEEILQEIIQSALPLIHNIDFCRIEEYALADKLSRREKHLQLQEQTPWLIYSSLPPILPGPDLAELCELNMAEKQKVQAVFSLFKFDFKSCGGHFLLDPARAHQLLASPQVRLSLLSRILGRDIFVSAKAYRKLLNYSLQALLVNPKVEMGFSSPLFGDMDLDYGILAQNVTGAVFWDASPEGHMTFLEETKMSTAVYECLDNMWYSIPEIQRDKTTVARLIRELIKNSQ